MCGESGEVDDDVVAEWISDLIDICDGYDPKDIGNCDETALFYRLLPSKSMSLSGETCSGGKFSKERVTVMLTVFGDGSILNPLVIGKSARPRCFKKIDINNLGVQYFSNKKAWMTSIIFKEYLKKLNDDMMHQNRKILLFVDNASSHVNINLSNIRLVFLPPKTTAKLQPLDAGIICNLKVNYRKLMLQHLLLDMENCKNISELTKKKLRFWIQSSILSWRIIKFHPRPLSNVF